MNTPFGDVFYLAVMKPCSRPSAQHWSQGSDRPRECPASQQSVANRAL